MSSLLPEPAPLFWDAPSKRGQIGDRSAEEHYNFQVSRCIDPGFYGAAERPVWHTVVAAENLATIIGRIFEEIGTWVEITNKRATPHRYERTGSIVKCKELD
ncbi:MAG: hypothetical protein KatS3mg112_0563 [Thermogutta sp.]|nr:MAG: hypothetical protein KatS3mg112_0563 [Thermogutta sp.]